jgi:hypothetical protein
MQVVALIAVVATTAIRRYSCKDWTAHSVSGWTIGIGSLGVTC